MGFLLAVGSHSFGRSKKNDEYHRRGGEKRECGGVTFRVTSASVTFISNCGWDEMQFVWPRFSPFPHFHASLTAFATLFKFFSFIIPCSTHRMHMERAGRFLIPAACLPWSFPYTFDPLEASPFVGSCLWDTYLDWSEIEATRQFSSAMSSLTMLIPVYDPTLPGHTFCSTRFTRAATSPIDHNQRSISPLPSSCHARHLPGTYLPPISPCHRCKSSRLFVAKTR
jgi:hypothetical protein